MREGTSGDTFYIISDGGVRVTKKSAGREEEIRTLARGDYFGEQVMETLLLRQNSRHCVSHSLFVIMWGGRHERPDKTFDMNQKKQSEEQN